ncbi:MAG: gliding motility lipoprotein GldD [Bacteroidota bacterium]|jgi:gliding motility-associated lipoprotein GldD
MNTYLKLVFTSLFLLFTWGCEENYVPKPRGYQRLDLPAHNYQSVSNPCGFSIDIPRYAILSADTHPTAEPCWYNLNYIPFNATLHLSVKSFSKENELFKMMEDSRTMVYKHTVKADEIYEINIRNAYLNGMLYELSGNTATNFQFYVTDNKKHFLRGALYFNVRTNTDSIAPALEHLKADVLHMLETLRWN